MNRVEMAKKAECQRINDMKDKAKDFISKAEKLGIKISNLGMPSFNLYGVSIYFQGIDNFGNTYHFRLSDHDCQRGTDTITKIGHTSYEEWLLDYEKKYYPERFEWEYTDRWITRRDGTKIQVKKFIGRK